MTAKGLEEALHDLTEMISQVHGSNARLTEELARSRGLSPNDILFAGTVVLNPVTWAWGRDFEVPFASVFVCPIDQNQAFSAYNVANSAFPGDAGTYAGAGRFHFPNTVAMVLPIVGHHLAIWGTGGAGMLNVVVSSRVGSAQASFV